MISASGIRFYRLHKIRETFVKWKLVWRRKVELMELEDTIQSKGIKAKKQRIFLYWKHCIF